ncbi:hypothetical protein FNI11_13625 [Salmonella enterica subsp. salamae]|nr:hypothetical protein [Salmonella enterica subsp. salamae]ECJ2281392.1 hypothetical protein [Salmonella enterica subsp. salamae]
MKFKETFRAIVLKPFMICGEVATPGEEVELLGNEYRSLLFNKKIRALNEKGRDQGDSDAREKGKK